MDQRHRHFLPTMDCHQNMPCRVYGIGLTGSSSRTPIVMPIDTVSKFISYDKGDRGQSLCMSTLSTMEVHHGDMGDRDGRHWRQWENASQ